MKPDKKRKHSLTISVITIVYNGENEIERTIKSVINQTYQNIEYILIDGGSTDSTMSVVEKYHNFFTKIVSERDNGIYNAMNKGLSYVTGDYVIFANSGDAIASETVFQSMIDTLTKQENMPDLVYGNYAESYEGNVSREIQSYGHERVWYGMFASHQSMFYRAGLIKEFNIIFDESYKVAADYKFTLQVVANSKYFLKLPICISLFDTTGVSCSNQDLGLYEADRARKEVLRMSYLKRRVIILISKVSRFIKSNFSGIYRLYR